MLDLEEGCTPVQAVECMLGLEGVYTRAQVVDCTPAPEADCTQVRVAGFMQVQAADYTLVLVGDCTPELIAIRTKATYLLGTFSPKFSQSRAN